jgi:hypothetical protein
VKVANYISIFCDEVTSVDNQSRWLSLHAYVIKNWSWIPILVSLERVRIDYGDIIRIITQALLIDVLIGESLSFKLTMWVFFKVPRLELCDKFNWIMFFTCKAYIAWLIKLIWSYKPCLSWPWFVGWRICSKPYMPTTTKASIGIWSWTSLLKSWKFKVIICWRMSKQGEFPCWNLQRGWLVNTTL